MVVGTGIRIQTLAVAHRSWGWGRERIASEYGLSRQQVKQALEFAEEHRSLIERSLAAEAELERASA